MSERPAGTILIISQVYVPDPTSVGQHMHDAAAELARRGHRVVVLASARGYGDPSQRYPKRETRDGVDIRRLPLASFGKSSVAIRLLGGFLFTAQAVVRGLFTRKLSGILVSTSPPMAPLAGVAINLLRRRPVTYWAMDINPDQMIAMGLTRAGSWPAKLFDAMNRMILRRASAIVALDRFMADSLREKASIDDRLTILPPWPHEEADAPLAHEDNPFREEQNLSGKFVIMYSGNISPAHPLTTILEAARRLQDDQDLLFLFVGGGLGKAEIERYQREHGLSNVRLLPYQPLERLRYSLSAADVHLVSMGPEMVGIVHPCKVYGALAVARPVLLLGPAKSHIGELLGEHGIGWQVEHGAVDEAERAIREMRAAGADELTRVGERAQALIRTRLSKPELRGRFADVVEEALGFRR